MVLCWRRHGRVGGCQIIKKDYLTSDWINKILYRIRINFIYAMTDQISLNDSYESGMYLENYTLRNELKIYQLELV